VLDLLENPECLRSPDLRLEEVALRGVPYGCSASEFPVALVSQVTLAPIVKSSSWSHEQGASYRDAAGQVLSLSDVISNALQFGGVLHFPEDLSFKFDNGRVAGFALYGKSLNFFQYLESYAQFVKEFGVADIVQAKEAYGDLMGYEHYYEKCQKFVEWDEMSKRGLILINFGMRRLEPGAA
jgi:hypothetical protein